MKHALPRIVAGLWSFALLAGCDGGQTSSGEGGSGGSGGSSGGTAGTGAVTSSGGSTGSVGPMTCDDPVVNGKATYYDFADGSGACSFDPTPDDLLVGAMNFPDYQASAACGACAAIDGPNGSVTVRIVDLCPECESGHIDLSPEAFSMIADLSAGVVPITWRYVSCNYPEPIQYKFKEGSNQWWTAVQIRRHVHRIAKLEYEKDGAFIEVARTDYNYFVEDAGMGPGPYHFRVTDVLGQTLEDTGIPFIEAGIVDGKGQFPACLVHE